MTKLLKPGITKPKRAKYPTSLLIMIIMIILVGFPSFACTRSVSKPAELTEAAIRFEITKIGMETSVPKNLPLAEVQKTYQPIPYRSSTPVPTIPSYPISTEIAIKADNNAKQVATEKTYITPFRSISTLMPTPRNTIPIEPINADITFTPVPSVKAYVPIEIQPLIPTLEITIIPTEVVLPDLESINTEKLLYVTQNGDTLQNIANRFGVTPDQISSTQPISANGFLNPNINLFINAPKDRVYESAVKILPDEYIVFSKTATDYDLQNEINQAGGYLSYYSEETSDGLMSGSEIIYKVCRDYSINPIVIIALLEYKSHWVYGFPRTPAEKDYPMGWIESTNKGLYKQVSWAATVLSEGYYGWRYGKISQIPFYKYPKPPYPIYFEPTLNAGSVAIQYLFSQLYVWDTVDAAIYSDEGFFSTFTSMFGNVWENYSPDPNGLNANLRQIELTLPFSKSEKWAMTGGPHAAWTTGSPYGALDFAPPSQYHGCISSDRWVLAAAPGIVVRTGKGIVIVDMDGDGLEETGWSLMYLHIATNEKVPVGTVLERGSRIGHPSCEGGSATGTHVHLARKYNGEWINATGPLPFVLSNWTAYEGSEEYLGGMTRGNEIVQASTVGSSESIIRY